MSNKAYEETSIQAIATAIRAKNGSSDTYTVGQMAQAIENIPAGGLDLEDFLMKSANDPSGGLGVLDLSGMTTWDVRSSALSGANFNAIILPSFTGTPNKAVPSKFAANSNTLEVVEIGNGFSDIYPDAFSDCNNLAEIHLPPTLTNIAMRAFQNCESLGTDGMEKLPDAITIIGDYAFMSCSALALTALPVSIRRLGIQAFANCSSLVIDELPATLVNIGNSCFESSGIGQMDVQCSLHTAKFVFQFCEFLEMIKIKGADFGTGSQNNNCGNCTSLKHVWISQDCLTIGAGNNSYGPFTGCSQLTDIYCEATEQPTGWGAYWNYIANNTQATVHWGVSEEDFDAIVAAA